MYNKTFSTYAVSGIVRGRVSFKLLNNFIKILTLTNSISFNDLQSEADEAITSLVRKGDMSTN